ncbi:hypothetical protein, partial [Segatella oris]|uniref:hypothetical protein n=1 Tax=Segatella oris TaxID=28135 RepID=UPI001C30B2D2
AESRFSAFFVRRTPTKRGFSRFLLIVGVRKVVFRDFSISSADDGHFSAISAFPRGWIAVS